MIGGSKSIRAHGLPLAMPAAVPEMSAHLVAFHFSPECEHVAGFRAQYDVMLVDGAFNPARLVRAFEMSGELRTVLLDFDVLRRSAAVGIVGVIVHLPSTLSGGCSAGGCCARETPLTVI